MSGRRLISFELTTLLYFLTYVPNIVVTRLVTSTPNPHLGHPPTGLQTLPAALLMNLLLTYAFIWVSGWHRDAHARMLGTLRVPVPTRYTALSAVGTALVLFTVPLSFTFRNVSIPFMQLLMRGDILLIAPVVDWLCHRRVRWWSWVALLLVAASIVSVLWQRGGKSLPPLAILTVALYVLGYFIRLAVMTRVSKSGDPAGVRGYFVEEKIVALPLAVLMLAVLSWFGRGSQAGELAWGFVSVWTDPVIWSLAFIAVTLTFVSVFAAIILLDPRENSFCVPVERTASLLAGLLGAWVLHWIWRLPAPPASEMLGASMLLVVIPLLWLAPRLERRRSP
jgi:hypothetical protein